MREWWAKKLKETECDSRRTDRLCVTEMQLKEEVSRQPQQYRMNGERRRDAHQTMNSMKVGCVNVRG